MIYYRVKQIIGHLLKDKRIQRNTIFANACFTISLQNHQFIFILSFGRNFQDSLCCALLLLIQGNNEVFWGYDVQGTDYAILKITKSLLVVGICQTRHLSPFFIYTCNISARQTILNHSLGEAFAPQRGNLPTFSWTEQEFNVKSVCLRGLCF